MLHHIIYLCTLAQIRAQKKGWTWCPRKNGVGWGRARGWLRTVLGIKEEKGREIKGFLSGAIADM